MIITFCPFQLLRRWSGSRTCSGWSDHPLWQSLFEPVSTCKFIYMKIFEKTKTWCYGDQKTNSGWRVQVFQKWLSPRISGKKLDYFQLENVFSSSEDQDLTSVNHPCSMSYERLKDQKILLWYCWVDNWPFQNSAGNWGEFQMLTNRQTDTITWKIMLRLVIWPSMMLLGWTETKLWTLKYASKSIQASLILRQRPPKP